MYPVRSAVAFQVAGVTKVQYNQAVMEGFFPCAPEATQRQPRQFTDDDLIALVFFGRLLSAGIPPRCAGPIACDLRERLTQEPGFSEVHHGPIDDDGKGGLVDKDTSLFPQVFVSIDVGYIRSFIDRRIADILKE